MQGLQFSRERLGDVVETIEPMLKRHYEDVAFDKLGLSPSIETYKSFEELGLLRFYTARKDTIIGYHAFILQPHIHYKEKLGASQCALFIEKEHRGFGWEFLKWCVSELDEEGVDISYMTVTPKYDYSNILKRLGYRKMEEIYSRVRDG